MKNTKKTKTQGIKFPLEILTFLRSRDNMNSFIIEAIKSTQEWQNYEREIQAKKDENIPSLF
ncbi:hypothetical protein L8X40_08185 [Campylobacter sp. CNRCH_2013_0855]|uniref:hypothetical protein n=1 Tax=Campylobacter sp. CNRCH_2013_0855 TaxID=2911600 RepID=UPI0021E683CE|nr:hypothetical protein [Campylobacter sp. CNRCH_2013_0855]MCV3552473.1 hypothetical protein [Campylobacter sp. CNRCH_2013_0855]